MKFAATMMMAAALLPAGAAFAQEARNGETPPQCNNANETPDDDCARGINDFGFGVGLAVQLGVNAVDEAEVEAGVVRVTREADALAGVVLEGHYLFGAGGPSDTEIGVGPFVAVQAGSADVIDSVGLGLMVGLRRRQSDTNNRGWGSGFNVGIGAMFDPNVKKLGDGIIRNEPLPPGETDIRYREEHAIRGVLMITYSP